MFICGGGGSCCVPSSDLLFLLAPMVAEQLPPRFHLLFPEIFFLKNGGVGCEHQCRCFPPKNKNGNELRRLLGECERAGGGVRCPPWWRWPRWGWGHTVVTGWPSVPSPASLQATRAPSLGANVTPLLPSQSPPRWGARRPHPWDILPHTGSRQGQLLARVRGLAAVWGVQGVAGEHVG